MCLFDAGVPASNSDSEAYLTFTDQTTGGALTTDSHGQTLTNELTVDSSLSGLTCSYAGGCSYSIQGNGLSSLLLDEEATSVEICGNRCELDVDQSNGSEAVCKVPALATSYSAE